MPEDHAPAFQDPFVAVMLFLGAVMIGAGGVVFWLILTLHL
ncbi:hypothetical protein TPB0596_31120 [Tsukamurella pulmonis]|nr:hypothetical protein [Tsukamurella pulmonis]BDD83349.1 hypothetical protein TPB0596_31120 [Tsukamurella pulmonis]